MSKISNSSSSSSTISRSSQLFSWMLRGRFDARASPARVELPSPSSMLLRRLLELRSSEDEVEGVGTAADAEELPTEVAETEVEKLGRGPGRPSSKPAFKIGPLPPRTWLLSILTTCSSSFHTCGWSPNGPSYSERMRPPSMSRYESKSKKLKRPSHEPAIWPVQNSGGSPRDEYGSTHDTSRAKSWSWTLD